METMAAAHSVKQSKVNSRILVTGARGFVGQPLCIALAARGYTVSGTARIKAGDESRPAVEALRVTGDLESFQDWDLLLRNVDAVIHLAARVHVMGKGSAPVLAAYRRTNVTVTENLVRAAAAAGVRRFIFASSVKAVGEGGTRPYSETSAVNPTDPYGMSKLEAEQAVQAIGKQTGIETVILRLPLVYGPGVRANFFRLMQLVDRGLPLPLASVGNRRSMIFLGNLVDALRMCLSHKNAAGQIFMVSDGDDLSTPDLIRRIATAMGKKACLVKCPPGLLRIAGSLAGKGPEARRLIGSLSVDSHRIQNELGWTPPYTVEQGLARTVAWYREAIAEQAGQPR